MTKASGDVTRLLVAIRKGESGSKEQLVELLQKELALMARRFMRHQRANHTLQPTALVNEVYIRLLGEEPSTWQNRAHFLACAARAMRQILVDHARRGAAGKRGGKQPTVSIEDRLRPSGLPLEQTLIASGRTAEVIALDEALDALAMLDRRQAHIVELRFFGGLTEMEIGNLLGIAERTVRREWTIARLWLRRRLSSREVSK
jgi:RNA polymerase sigma factor (TIGR02999 family)